VHVYTTFADCYVSEYLQHFRATKGIVPSVSRVSDGSGNQHFLNITNVTLGLTRQDLDDAALRRNGYTHNSGSCHCFLPLRQN
jgi:hypothetical protein